MVEELQEFVETPIDFLYYPEDYSSWTEKTSITLSNGILTKTTVRTFLMDDGDTEVMEKSVSQDFNKPNEPFELSLDESDILTEYNLSKMPTENNVVIAGNLQEEGRGKPDDSALAGGPLLGQSIASSFMQSQIAPIIEPKIKKKK